MKRQALALWSTGRHPWLAATSIAAAGFVTFRWWYLNFPTRLLGQFEPRWFQILELIPAVVSVVALAALAPCVPLTDRLAPAARRKVSASAAFAVVAATALTPITMTLVLEFLPHTWWMTERSQFVRPDQRFLDVVEFDRVLAYSSTILVVAGIAAAAIALTGPVLGTGCALLGYGALALLQSSPAGPLLRDSVPAIAWFALAMSLALSALWIWYRTGAGAPLRPTTL